ncbi:ABC transporter substrate-binding protein [Kineosporia sp. J2-2]|uniref:ABC transporter substrate-binding protein n=1 Tax=Kineosporia corallincola TaxID=2835133 RepID=A0ABS5TB19_9ACTN|nr:ABC transporter substrate-binding protein [Kineosporia corallincola]MBT0768275.1 ABC transporter substrate-binding protein [Kineosporia corallincola]
MAALALLAAGCADRGSDEPATGADAMRLNLGQTSDSVAFFPFFVAEQEGYFEDEGLTLGERPRLGTGAKSAAALQSGSIDVAGGVMTDVYNLYGVNDDAQLIGTLTDEFYVDIVAGDGIPTSEDDKPLAERVKALQGKNIGITGPGSGTEALLTYLLRQQGMDAETDITMVNLGSDPSASIGALKAGRVDALSFFQPIGQQAEVTGVGRLFISPARGDVPEMKGQTHGVAFTTRSVINRKGPAVQAFLRALKRAETLINEDTAKTTELFQEYQETMDPKAVADILPILQAEVPDDPTPDAEGYGTSATFHQDSGLIEQPPAFDDLVPGDFIGEALSAAP